MFQWLREKNEKRFRRTFRIANIFNSFTCIDEEKFMTKMNLVQAINSALKNEMERDSKIIILGEDVGINGGVFRVTDGLWQKFGEERVIDTPLAEAGIVGVSVGLAVNGMNPVAEIQFDGFMAPAFDQIISHISRMRSRSRGRFSCHLVIRSPYGGGIRALEHHSESPEAHFAHTPGIKVVIPSCPYDAKGLLISAIRDQDPVIFLEPKRIYRAIKEEVPDEAYTVPIGEAKIVQDGADVTLIAYGAMIKIAKEAAEKLKDKCSVEIIDVRSIFPLDEKKIIESVKKTGRAVVLHEAPKTSGFGAELASLIQEKAFLHLKSPIKRVAGYDVPVPLPKLENYYLPDVARIVSAIEQSISF